MNGQTYQWTSRNIYHSIHKTNHHFQTRPVKIAFGWFVVDFKKTFYAARPAEDLLSCREHETFWAGRSNPRRNANIANFFYDYYLFGSRQMNFSRVSFFLACFMMMEFRRTALSELRRSQSMWQINNSIPFSIYSDQFSCETLIWDDATSSATLECAAVHTK